jgi:hypothetical protein
MSKLLKVNDCVINEYGHVGLLVEINYPNEAVVDVLNYNLIDDLDYCDIRKCRLATKEEIINSINLNKLNE